ncbi:Ig-like domain-containing protein [Colwellia hornerae]|uniref:Cadherin-like domain-containing protein n=1 Tax=Colwellia hornerae TaxID=89402 RepID=A0A5C6QMX4_9GAMM|nr:Ig-like domain-containing protein [Colwellia hornerae]TWX54621.1 hypothetical protein ESZ28_07875 [Colwellia hornerae]TWX61061.1 hypothetical protein ESZ26_06650 [Colwellia hornerae]TWX70314.1 hypothetical protein ESZ27_04140 [Colwellia hornerae]
MLYSKKNTASHLSSAFKLKGVALSLAATMLVSGCSDDVNELPITQNAPPTTISVDLITQTETPITDMLSGNDENGDALTFSLVQEPTLGMVTIDSNGGFTYQPNDEVTGSDSFTFAVTDGINFPVNGTINITIEALEVSFASYSRAAFSQQSHDEPLAVNGRVFVQDAEDPAAYDDLFQQ